MSKHAASTLCLLVMIVLAFGSVDSETSTTSNTTTPEPEDGAEVVATEDAEPKPSEPSKAVAWYMAQQFVTEQLKSPSTADFGSAWGGEYQSAEDTVTQVSRNSFKVRGWVDAQNAFGATVRNHFTCDLVYVGNDRWRCVGLQITPR